MKIFAYLVNCQKFLTPLWRSRRRKFLQSVAKMPNRSKRQAEAKTKEVDTIIEKFRDDAKILIGTSFQEGIQFNNNEIDKSWSLIEKNKEEYRQSLENIFKINSFVNINFADLNIKKMNNHAIYGIQIEQNYYSSLYADHGYLFIMLDLRDIKDNNYTKQDFIEKIMVRSWQPDKGIDNIIGLEDWDLNHYLN